LAEAHVTPLRSQPWWFSPNIRRLSGHFALLAPLFVASLLVLRYTTLTSRSTLLLGAVGPPVSQGFHAAETNSEGRGFRWTKGVATIAIPPLGSTAHILQIELSAPRPDGQNTPVATSFSLNEQLLLQTSLTGAPRRYALLVPAEALSFSDNRLHIQSTTFAPVEQNSLDRQLGVAIFWLDWQATGPTPWLVPSQWLLISSALGLLYILLALNRVGLVFRVLVVLLCAALLLAMRHSDPRFHYRWNALLATGILNILLVLACVISRIWTPDSEQSMACKAWLQQHWLAFVGHFAVSVLMLAPLLAQFRTHTFGPPGDNWEYLWKMQWFVQALIEQQHSPVYVPQAFYPGGIDLTYSEIAPAHNLINLPLTYLFGFTTSYNLSIFASFVLTAFFTYLLAQRLGAKPGAAWVAGLIFAFCVRRYHHVLGHFGMTGSQWLPLLLYAWEGLLSRRRVWDGALAGLAYSLATWSSLIYGTTAPFFLLIYTLGRLGIRGIPGLLAAWRALLVMAMIALALVLPVAQPYLELQLQGGGIRHPYVELVANAIPPLAYLLPNPFHPLWGQWAQQWYPREPGEYYASVGYATLVLALAGLWLGRKRREVWALAAAMCCFMLLSFGPELRLGTGPGLPLPALWLYEYAPVFGSIRTWGRMLLYVMPCLAVLAALALSALPPLRYRAGLLIAATLILAESVAVLPMSSLQARPVDNWLREQPGTGSVVHLPHDSGGPREFYTLLFSAKPTSQGHGKILPAVYREGLGLLAGFPAESALRLLQRWQADYLVVDVAGMNALDAGWQAELAAQPLLRKVYDDGAYQVYWLMRFREQG
jgi:hypothetical protein